MNDLVVEEEPPSQLKHHLLKLLVNMSESWLSQKRYPVKNGRQFLLILQV